MIYDTSTTPSIPDPSSALQARVAAELKSGKAERDIILDLVRDGSVRNVPEADVLIAAARGMSAETPTPANSGAAHQRESDSGSDGTSNAKHGSRLRYFIGGLVAVGVLALLYFSGGIHGTGFFVIPLFIGLRFWRMSNRGGRRGSGPWTVPMSSSAPSQRESSQLPARIDDGSKEKTQ